MPQKTCSGAGRKERAVVAFFFAAAHNRPKDAFGKRVRKVEYKRDQSSGNLQPVKATAYVDDILVLENSDPMTMEYALAYHNELTPTGIEGRTENSSGNTAYYIKDHLGSVRSVVDDQGQLVEATMYDAYGKQYVQAYGPERFKERFSGKEFDEDGAYPEYNVDGIGLNYFGFRYYDPVVGMWTTTDPVEQLWSPYDYCAGDPINLTDPLGLYIPENEKKNDFVADKIPGGGNDGPHNDHDVGWAGWDDNPEVSFHTDPVTGELSIAKEHNEVQGDVGVKGNKTKEKEFDGPHGEKDKVYIDALTSAQKKLTNLEIIKYKVMEEIKEELSDITNYIPIQGGIKFTPKQLAKFKGQLTKHGIKSLLKSQKTISSKLSQHIEKLEKLKKIGGHTSSVEREIKNFQNELNAIDEVLKSLK